MTEATPKTYGDFVLPPDVVSRVDVSRLLRELEQVDSDLTTVRVHAKSGVETPLPVLSDTLEVFLTQNGLSLQDSRQSTEAITQLRLLKDKAPVIHMTFASPADRESLREIAQWLRREVHPQALIAVGLQPALVAGVYLRTPNHVHDFSVRNMLQSQREALVKQLGAFRG